jgi:hypothetical protein
MLVVTAGKACRLLAVTHGAMMFATAKVQQRGLLVRTYLHHAQPHTHTVSRLPFRRQQLLWTSPNAGKRASTGGASGVLYSSSI